MSNEKLRLQLRHESTLGFWRDMIVTLWGAESRAVNYLDRMITRYGKEKEIDSQFGTFMGALNEIHRGTT